MEYNYKQIQLMETAERLFATKGYAATSIRDIGRESKANSAMISYYFGSKENLLQAILDYRTTNLSQFLNEIVHRHLSARKRMQQAVKVYVQKCIERRYFFALLIQVQMLESDSQALAHFYALRDRNVRWVQTIIRAGQANGVFRKKLDVPLLMSTISGTVNHYILNQAYFRKMNQLQDLPEAEFLHHLQRELSRHLDLILQKILFKKQKKAKGISEDSTGSTAS
ncbi:TetR/AcrR family transcriptional regulator [Rufibacter immobilis]|uniref:TetR/AcrR family transcriptional regulator n=1 Tax=Rufibacter immobilis TaxID=1348778 RepID=A0A3M9N2I2_9BACT|nr:TetR family transcriptional regulator [Rufibacter immobilis]RNI31936.1 TetR/AcrR family transcriptional regulator [Rufibacter immobilis]